MGFWDDLMGRTASDASNRAAQDTYAKQLAAGGAMRGAGDDYSTAITNLYQPTATAGSDALRRVLTGLGLPGGDGADFTAAYRGLPGYQAGLDTGTTAALRGVNASGMSNSGRALKALQRFGSDYEDQRVGDYLTRLMGVSDRGMQATNAIGEGYRGRLGAYMGAGQQDYGAAGTIGQGQVAGEQARSDALSRLIGAGTYLAGSFLGGSKMPKFG